MTRKSLVCIPRDNIRSISDENVKAQKERRDSGEDLLKSIFLSSRLSFLEKSMALHRVVKTIDC